MCEKCDKGCEGSIGLAPKAAAAYEKVMGHPAGGIGLGLGIIPPAPEGSALAEYQAKKEAARKRYDSIVYPALGEYERVKAEAAVAYFKEIGEEV